MNSLLAFLIAALPAFPGAVGFGSQTVGGSGRHLSPPQTQVMKVVSLADSGPGTLRECIDATVPRTCIFEVSGTINLASNLRVLNPYISIHGETAPGAGVMLKNAELGILTHDVIVRHLHIRAGDDSAGSDPGSRGGLGFYGDNPNVSGATHDIIADHLSLSWAVDECVDTWYQGVHDATLSNSIISEPLYASIHPSGPQSTAVIVGEDAQRLSFVRNLIAHAFSRNPYYKTGNSSELVNNVVYHWGFGKDGHDGSWAMVDLSNYDHVQKLSFHNFIGNVFKPGPDSESRFAPIFSSPGADAFPEGGRIYVRGNIGPMRSTNGGDEWAITNGLPKQMYCTSAPAVSGSSVTDIPPQQAYDEVLATAGAFGPNYRDTVDQRIVSEVRAGTGKFVNSVAEAGGWPVMPEQHVTHTLPADSMHVEQDGYTALEHWLREFPKALSIPTPTPSPVPSPTPPLVYPPCQ